MPASKSANLALVVAYSFCKNLIKFLVCDGLSFMGIELDIEKNKIRESGNREINTKTSKTKIYIIPTNEELVIAKDTYKLSKLN